MMRAIGHLFFLTAIILVFSTNTATAQQQWVPLGKAGFTAGITGSTSLAFDAAGKAYVSFLDGMQGARASVMRHDDTGWAYVGNPGFTSAAAYWSVLAFDNNGILHMAFSDYSVGAKATVLKWTGINWVAVGAAGMSIGQAMYVNLVFDSNNDPYVAYTDFGNSQKVTVMKYNGSNWAAVGSVGLSAGGSAYTCLAIDGTTPYVAYKDYNASYQLTVMKYNGSSWASVGVMGLSAAQVEYAQIAIDKNHIPYIAYQDAFVGQKITVRKWSGSNWVYVGTPGFSPAFADDLQLALDNNDVPYVSFRDYSNPSSPKATVMKYNGTSWIDFGNPRFTPGNYYYPSFKLDKNNKPHLSITDQSLGDRITVYTFGCPAEDKIQLCAITTDTVSGKNIVLWDVTSPLRIDSYKVYRENGSVYDPVGTVAGNINNFTDPTATPATHSYKYKLTLLDSCGREMSLDSSVTHQTMLLVFDSLKTNKAYLSWNKYVGVPNLTYKVKRSTNARVYTDLASFSITGIDTTYIDANPPIGTNVYRIDAILPDTCNGYGAITSNTVSSIVVGVNNVTKNSSISISPNPTTGIVKIALNEPVRKIEVYSLLGAKMISATGGGEKETIINLSMLPAGVYLLKVNDVYNTSFMKQ